MDSMAEALKGGADVLMPLESVTMGNRVSLHRTGTREEVVPLAAEKAHA